MLRAGCVQNQISDLHAPCLIGKSGLLQAQDAACRGEPAGPWIAGSRRKKFIKKIILAH